MKNHYYITNAANVWLNTVFGLAVPGHPTEAESFKYYVLFCQCYVLIVLVLFTIQIVQMDSLSRICIDFCAAVTLWYGIIISVSLKHMKAKFDSILFMLNEITHDCYEDLLDPENEFTNKITSQGKFIKGYTIASTIVSMFAALFFFIVNIFRSMKLFWMDGEKVVAIDIFFPHIYQSPNFQISQAIGMFGVIMGGLQKLAIECYILSFISLLTAHLQHLRFTMKYVFAEDSSCTFKDTTQKCNSIENKLKEWIKIHQKILSLVSDLNDLLSPLLAFYLSNIVAVVAVSVFSITMAEELSTIETITLGCYCTNTMVSLFLLCYFGSTLTEKNQDLAKPFFWLSYKDGFGGKEIQSSLKMIYQRIQTSLIMSPYRSPSFELSKTSFVSFSWSIISLYMAIRKMKELGH